MDEVREDNLEEIREKLKKYAKEDITFNEPHFTQQALFREGSKEEVIQSILHPEKLVYSYQEQGKYGDTKHCLHFKVSNTRTLRIPVIFNKDGEKNLYILTYILRYRPWQNMIRKKARKT